MHRSNKKRLETDLDLKAQTKLTSKNIADLINLCISTSDFLYENKHFTTHDSEPIGLSLMVTFSQICMDHTINKT